MGVTHGQGSLPPSPRQAAALPRQPGIMEGAKSSPQPTTSHLVGKPSVSYMGSHAFQKALEARGELPHQQEALGFRPGLNAPELLWGPGWTANPSPPLPALVDTFNEV